MSIHFSGVDDDAVVWLNGREVGSHTGGSDPFAVDLTHTLRNGENLVVRASYEGIRSHILLEHL